MTETKPCDFHNDCKISMACLMANASVAIQKIRVWRGISHQN